jgi:hypothetical protein
LCPRRTEVTSPKISAAETTSPIASRNADIREPVSTMPRKMHAGGQRRAKSLLAFDLKIDYKSGFKSISNAQQGAVRGGCYGSSNVALCALGFRAGCWSLGHGDPCAFSSREPTLRCPTMLYLCMSHTCLRACARARTQMHFRSPPTSPHRRRQYHQHRSGRRNGLR